MGQTTSESSFWKQGHPAARSSLWSHRTVWVSNSGAGGPPAEKYHARPSPGVPAANVFHNRRAATAVDTSNLASLTEKTIRVNDWGACGRTVGDAPC